MALQSRTFLLNRYVILIFFLPSIGYLGFLSQFVIGEPAGLLRTVMEVLFLPALPVMALYSMLLDTLPQFNQALGTIGFFVFAYLFAVILVSGVHVGLLAVRDQGLLNDERDEVTE